jgi:hypothetical protein
MILDIVFDLTKLIIEVPKGVVGGTISSYSLDGSNYAYNAASVMGGETSSIFIN